MVTPDPFDVKFTSREVSAWGGLALLKRMPGGMDFKSAMQSWGLPKPGSNRGYAPEQLIEQMIVSIWCGAARFCHADITRLDSTLMRLFGWGRAAGHKAIVGLFRADSGFYDKAIVALLKGHKISHIISARLTQALQQAIVDQCQWQQVAPGLQVSQLRYQPHGWDEAKRLVVVRQHMQRKVGGVPGKTLSLFADDPDLQGWRYGAMLTDLSLPAIEVWNLYRGRADCENRIKELKADFGLDSFVLRDFWATEAALGVSML